MTAYQYVQLEAQAYSRLYERYPARETSKIIFMTTSNSEGRIGFYAYRFDSFEVRVRAGVLHREGERLKIQELPFQMLLVLLERPGEMVTKEELGDRLWGSKTFIEVDKGLYVVAAKLREALGDDATRPRFIKTISGRGYRFIADVTPVVEADVTPVLESPVEPTQLVPQPEWPALTQTDEPTAHRRAGQVATGSLLAAITLTAIGIYAYQFFRRPLISNQDKIVAGGFTNDTGNPDLDKTLSFAIQLKLQQSPYLSLIPDQNFRHLVTDPDSAPLQDQLRACASLHGQLLLSGRILALAPVYKIVLMARRCADGRLLSTQQADADSQAAILSAFDVVTVRMRRQLGESDDSLRKFDVPLAQATSASLASLTLFNLGEEKRSLGLYSESIANYKLAVELDAKFALAYARLGADYSNTRQPSLSREYYQKAFELRDRTADRDRLYIITHYYALATGEIGHAIEDYELWRTIYPRDFVPTNNLAVEYLEIGQPQKTVEFARKAIQLDPTSKLPYGTLAEAYAKTGDYADANALCNDPAHAEDDFFALHDACFAAAFAQGNEPGMQRQLQWAHGKPQESILISDQAWVEMYRGRVSEGRRLISRAREIALQNKFIELAADLQLDRANLEADFGLMHEAREDAISGLDLDSGGPFEQALAALAFARVGDIARAEMEAKKAASQAPLDTIVNSAVLASVRAAIHLQRHDSQEAIQSLEETRQFDFCASIGPAPAYYRGLAYIQDYQPRQAIKEFQRLLEHRLLAAYPLYDPLAQLRLGRAYQMAGDNALAAKAYSEAARVWRDADPGFPPLLEIQAYQRELATR